MSAGRVGCLFVAVVLLASGCGKKGPLLYPDMLVAQPPQQLTVEQSGATLRLLFDLPTKDLSGRRLEDLDAVVIARRVYRDGDCISCQDLYQEIRKINVYSPESSRLRQGNRIVWEDTDVRIGERYQYQLRAIQKSGVTGGVVNSGLVKVQPAPPSPVIKAESVFGGMIVISLERIPVQNARIAGFRIYRAAGDDSELQLLASLGADKRQYEDQSTQRGVMYRYAAKTLVMRADGLVAESSYSGVAAASVADDPK